MFDGFWGESLLRMIPGWRNRGPLQWRGPKEFQRRAGYVSARIFMAIATDQGIYIPRSPYVHAIGGKLRSSVQSQDALHSNISPTSIPRSILCRILYHTKIRFSPFNRVPDSLLQPE